MAAVEEHGGWLGLAMATLLLGCSSPAGPIDSGLPEDKLMSELTADELAAYCESSAIALTESYADIDVCVVLAITSAGSDYFESRADFTDASLRALCDAYYSSCKQDPARNGGKVTILPCMTSTEGADSCQVTVGQMEQCSNDRLREDLAFLRVPLDCARTTRAEFEALADSAWAATGTGEPVSCDVVAANCPDGF